MGSAGRPGEAHAERSIRAQDNSRVESLLAPPLANEVLSPIRCHAARFLVGSGSPMQRRQDAIRDGRAHAVAEDFINRHLRKGAVRPVRS
jgi:hypothetical protein